MHENECIIAANPAAGGMRLGKCGNRLHALAEELRCPLIGLDCDSAEEWRQCVAEASTRTEVLVVAGGDGTFAEALNALRGDPLLGFMPCGSGNALAWALRMAGARPLSADAVRRRRSLRIGVMLCNGSRKALTGSVGLDALATHYNSVLSRPARPGKLRYVAALMAALRAYTPPDIQIRCDGRELAAPRCVTVIVSKQPFYGYGLLVNRGRLDDGTLSVRTVRGSLYRLPVVLAAAVLRIPPRHELSGSAAAVTIRCSEPQWMQCDGEAVCRGSEFTFEFLPGHVGLIV